MLKIIILFAFMKNIFHTENQKGKNKSKVAPKKHLGQHFLKDENIAAQIVNSFTEKCTTKSILEIGPGMGVLTKYLLDEKQFTTHAIEVDRESILWLKIHFPQLEKNLIDGDFLKLDLATMFDGKFSVIGNFPYNISSQIVFKVIENKNQIPLVVGMFQKEVAERYTAHPRHKEYGILSVLTQAFYDVEYLFSVDETVFIPPPKVKSGVVRFTRKSEDIKTDEKLFFRVVKTAFNQRRKKLRNAISQFQIDDAVLTKSGFIDKRAEELSVHDFVELTNLIMNKLKENV